MRSPSINSGCRPPLSHGMEGDLLISGKKHQTKFLMCQIPGLLAGNIFYINKMRAYLPEEHLHEFLYPEEFRDKFLCPEIFWHISLTVRIYSCIGGFLGPEEFLHSFFVEKSQGIRFFVWKKIWHESYQITYDI